MAFDENAAINNLAVLLHVAGGGTVGTPSAGTAPTTQAGQLGQHYLDNATQQASPSGATTTISPTGDPSASSTIDPVPEGTGVSQGYGVNGHPGIDLSVPLNTQLLAAQSGTITHASNDDPGGYGEWVEITTPDGYKIRYGHLHNANVAVGDQIKAGQLIGTSGGEAGGPTSGNSEGPHLHFEVRGPDGNTVDPTPWLAGGHQIVSASPTTVSTTFVSPDDQAAATIGNIQDVAAGKDATHTGKTTTITSTIPGGGSGSTSDADPAAVDTFLSAIRTHESGNNYTIYNQSGQSNASGAYQFLGSTWQGLGGSTSSAAEASPEEQDRIARAYALQLFNEFHSWRLVAIAWYGGPGIAEQAASGANPGSPEGQGSYLAYGDTISRMMAGGK